MGNESSHDTETEQIEEVQEQNLTMSSTSRYDDYQKMDIKPTEENFSKLSAFILSYMDKKTTMMISGYIKNIQQMLPQNNVHYNIPEGVIIMILVYYFVYFKFYEKEHDDGLSFINDN